MKNVIISRFEVVNWHREKLLSHRSIHNFQLECIFPGKEENHQNIHKHSEGLPGCTEMLGQDFYNWQDMQTI